MASRLRRIPKARFICREDITNSMGEHPVYITYSTDRKTAKTDTTVWVKREHWNDSRQCVKSSHPRHDQLNAMLQVKRHEIDDRLVELNSETPLTIDLLRKIVKEESIDDADESVKPRLCLRRSTVRSANAELAKSFEVYRN